MAETFAEKKRIPCRREILELTPPLVTVLQHDNQWFPAEFHPDKIRLITEFGASNLDGAKNLANVYALSTGADCIPSIGISLGKNWNSK